MSQDLLVDSDVLIDALRGNRTASDFLKGRKGLLRISVVTIAELFAGARNDQERSAISDFLQAFEPVAVDASSALQAGLFLQHYRKSHGVGLADCLIAAAALKTKSKLATLNRKHFPMLSEVLIPYEK